jgi:hypothetical protein
MSKMSLQKVTQLIYLRHFLIVNQVIKELKSKTAQPLRILDIGCGDGWYWLSGPLSSLVKNKIIELHVLEAERLSSDLEDIAISHIGPAPDALRGLDDNLFDFVTCFDVIEHFPKHQGYQLLYEIDRISKFGSAIFTPNGFIWQPPSNNNSFNAHLSGWRPRELSSLGWSRIFSAGGFRSLYGPYGFSKLQNSNLIVRGLGLILDMFSLVHPRFGFAFLALSNKKNLRK